jgi:serine/threonine protein kinase
MSNNLKSLTQGVLIEGKYKVITTLGQGGMGTVYLAEQLLSEKTVAVKVLKQNLSRDATKRFLREARVLTKLDHPNILRAFAVGAPADAAPYLVLEYIQGTSLALLIAERGALKWHEVADIFNQVLAGICYAHAHGVIHRDLKPSNIMIDDSVESKRVRIVDFGVANFVATSADQKLTQTGQLIGTPAYMAPELGGGAAPTPPSAKFI